MIQFDETKRWAWTTVVCLACIWLPGALSAIAQETQGPSAPGSKRLTGTVLLPSGSPAAGAEVLLATRDLQPNMSNGRPTLQAAQILTEADCEKALRDPDWVPPAAGKILAARTNALGEFTLPAPPAGCDYALIAFHDGGHFGAREADLTSPLKFILEPWGIVQGQVRVAGKPSAARVNLDVYPRYQGKPSLGMPYNYSAQTDAEGRFEIGRVPAGMARVSRELPGQEGYRTEIHWVEVGAGKTVHDLIGGAGRHLTGRVLLPAPIAEGMRFKWIVALTRDRDPQPKMPTGDNWRELPASQRAERFAAWAQSSEPYKIWQAQGREYQIQVGPDGRFSVDDVREGRYGLQANAHQEIRWINREGVPRIRYADVIASTVFPIKVDPAASNSDRKSIDLGDMRPALVEPDRHVIVGDNAPAFEAFTLDGKQLRLSDYRGKFVLLDVWATWCVPCRKEIAYLRDVYQSWSQDPRLVILGLSEDEQSQTAAVFVAKNEMRWPQAHLDSDATARLWKDYGISAIPSIWLISPDGKVLAKDLSGDQIKAAVERNLNRSASDTTR